MSKAPLTPAEIEVIETLRDAAARGDLYALLGVPPTAGRTELDAAFRERVRGWHPDRFFKRDAGELADAIQENFVHVNQAYKLLIDGGRRAAYDRENAPRRPPPSSVVVPPEVEDPPTGYEVRLPRQPAPAPEPGRPGNAAPRAAPPRGVERVRQQLAEQFGKARAHYQAGQTDAAEGRWLQAESALYLATRYDPKNATYKQAYEVAVAKAKGVRAVQYMTLADQASSLGRYPEAIENLRKAVECEPEDGLAYFQLGKLLAEYENDRRGAIDMLRRAVQKRPQSAPWRQALADLYEAVGLRANALREARAAMEIEPKSDKAKAMIKRLGG